MGDEGLECHVNKTNSILGLAMYFSYFLLFFKLFIENYVTQTRKAPAKGLPPKQKSIAAVTRARTTGETSRRARIRRSIEWRDLAAGCRAAYFVRMDASFCLAQTCTEILAQTCTEIREATPPQQGCGLASAARQGEWYAL